MRRATLYINRTTKAVIFLSTLSLRRATNTSIAGRITSNDFYPRSPCGERRSNESGEHTNNGYFYPRSPCGERLSSMLYDTTALIFLSTLSLRRATGVGRVINHIKTYHFYPRSPCGERQTMQAIAQALNTFLSTLSLRRATCKLLEQLSDPAFLSTLSLRRATRKLPMREPTALHFYPRSPCGERQQAQSLKIPPHGISIHALLAESDLNAHLYYHSRGLFLSTLSLRRATLC